MSLGFSYTGLIFIIMLFVPNILWTKNKPKDHDKYLLKENKLLLTLERTGEVAVTALSVICSDFNLRKLSSWSLWLAAAAIFMIMYEVWWIKYFRSDKEMKDFYSSFLGIPVAGASLPVTAFFIAGDLRKKYSAYNLNGNFRYRTYRNPSQPQKGVLIK